MSKINKDTKICYKNTQPSKLKVKNDKRNKILTRQNNIYKSSYINCVNMSYLLLLQMLYM